jgi:hypothetical protein
VGVPPTPEAVKNAIETGEPAVVQAKLADRCSCIFAGSNPERRVDESGLNNLLEVNISY